MKFRRLTIFLQLATIAFLCLTAARAYSQSATSTAGALHGQVLDPSNAAVAGATVVLTGADGTSTGAATSQQGAFDLKNLAPGKYTLEIVAKGFALYKNEDVEIAPDQTKNLNILLTIEEQQQQVTVEGETPTVDVNPANNAGAITISGKELDALPDDPDELQTDLEALAGPSAGPNGGQFYIDGFTAGQLPPKSSIREIRINQNPFSAEYDKVGYGRIEIFTKPGTDKWHGQVSVNASTSALNSENPFFDKSASTTPYPGYYSTQYTGNLGGPLGKKASFFFTADIRDINDVEIVDAQTVDPTTFAITPFSAAIPNPRTRYNIGPRVDYQLTKTNTLSVRYQYYRDNETNEGIGGFLLPSQGYNELTTEQTLQVSDTQAFGTNIINEIHFQYLRDESSQLPVSTAPTISVGGAFTGGGNNSGTINDNTNHYELQNYTSIQFSKHFLKFGGRLRGLTDSNFATSGFNGAFVFPSIQAYQATLQGTQQGAVQYSLTGNANPNLNLTNFSVGQVDVGLFIQDDWRIKPNITLSLGARFEAQNEISDHDDWAPRLGFAWGIGGHGKTPPKTVLRAGFGIFYDRFNETYALQAERLAGGADALTQFVVTTPGFFNATTPVPISSLPANLTLPSSYRLEPNLRSPSTTQTAVSFERQLTKIANMSVSYLNSRGADQLFTSNINTPFIGEYIPTLPLLNRPLGPIGNVYEYESEAIFRQNQLFVQATVRAGSKLLITSYYTLNYAKSDTSGANSFPSNPFNILADYGRASFDIRNRYFMLASIALPYGFRFSPFMIASSGIPYNVTLSQDILGSSQFNYRPTFATASTPSQNVVSVPGLPAFNTVPSPGEEIPVNYLTSAGRFTLNVRLSKTFGFGKTAEGPTGAGAGGPGGGGGGRGSGGGGGRGPGGPFGGGGGFGGIAGGSNKRYNITFSINARNLLNNVNSAIPSAVLFPPTATSPAEASPFFARPNVQALGPFNSNSANRQIYLQASFSF
jgi:Carboxypeptidase regulatory-like domain